MTSLRAFFTGRTIAVILTVVVLGGGILFYVFSRPADVPVPAPLSQPTETKAYAPERSVLGLSVEGREIEAFTYRSANSSVEARHLLFVGGIHGGYEWNSVLLAYAFMDYLKANPGFVRDGVAVTIIPSANPDGVYKIIGKEGRFEVGDVPIGVSAAPGRFNAHTVDLNRNFDCKWKPTGTWRGATVSAGSAPFSEPEARAIRDFVLDKKPNAVIFWHSQANAVYASECKNGILPRTREIMNVYALASGYPAVASFDAYEVAGDAEGWLASIGIPAITVELKTHETLEWEKNLAGIKALFGYYGR